jgi:uncharacterized protein (TIGR03437 family)
LISAGANSGIFSVQAAAFSSNQSASVTAAYNSSSQSVTFALTAPTLITSLACSLTGVMSGATSVCTVTLSQPAPAKTNVTLSSSTGLIAIPAAIVLAAGNTSMAFNANIGNVAADATGSVTAALGTSSQSVNFVLWSTPALSSFSCSPLQLTAGMSSLCTVALSKTAGNIVVSLSSSSSALTVPPSVTIPLGSLKATFSAATPILASGKSAVTATWNGLSKQALFLVSPATRTIWSASPRATVSQLSCAPKALRPAGRGICQIQLSGGDVSTPAAVQLFSSSPALRLPRIVTTRPGQSVVEFQVDAVTESENILVSALTGSKSVTETLTISSQDAFTIQVPGRQFAKYGSPIRFRVSTPDQALDLYAEGLPPGASFDSASGQFQWTPDATQIGVHQITFRAADSSGHLARASAAVEVGGWEPVATRIVNAATRSEEAICSSGAIAAIEGHGLGDGAATSDPSGASLELAGVKVWSNGIPVPVLSASASELEILCPDALPGAPLQFVVETSRGMTRPLRAIAISAAPGIFSLDGSGGGQGFIVTSGAETIAMMRNYRVPAQPAAAGEQLLIYATGLAGLTGISVQFGEAPPRAAAATAVPNRPGLYQVAVFVPETFTQSDPAVPLFLLGNTPRLRLRSNPVTIAIEGRQ